MKKIKAKISVLVTKYKELSSREKAQYTSKVTLLGNILMALGKIGIGIFSLSIFFVVSGIYSLGIGACKLVFLIGEKKAEGRVAKERTYYLLIAIILLASSIFYIIYMIRLFFIESTLGYELIPSIAIALISFVELGIAITGLTKSNRRKYILLSGLKCVNLSSAFTAIVLTQAALLSAAGELADYSRYNAISGIVFGIGCSLISVLMIIYYSVTAKTRFEIKTRKRGTRKMICPNCGKKIPNMMVACIRCGTLVDGNSINNLDNYLYDYLTVEASTNTVFDVAKYYGMLGYECSSGNSDFGTNGVTLYLKRRKDIKDKELLDIAQTELDRRVRRMIILERNIMTLPLTAVIMSGGFGTGAIVGGVLLAVLGGATGFVIGGIILAVLGLGLIGISYPLFKKYHKRKTDEINPLIEKEKDDIERLLSKSKAGEPKNNQ